MPRTRERTPTAGGPGPLAQQRSGSRAAATRSSGTTALTSGTRALATDVVKVLERDFVVNRCATLYDKNALYIMGSHASHPQRMPHAAACQQPDATNHATARNLCVNCAATELGNLQDTIYGATYEKYRRRARPRRHRQEEAPCGLGHRLWATESTVKPMIGEVTCFAMKARMSSHVDNPESNPRREGDRVHPAQGVDATATRDQQKLGYHIGDWVTANIEVKGIFELLVMDSVREGAMKYSVTGEVNLEGIASLVGVIGHFTALRLRPHCRAGLQTATPSRGRTTTGRN